MAIEDYTALELGWLIKEKKISAVEVVREAFQTIDQWEAEIHAFSWLDREGALKSAAAIQNKIDGGEELSPLAGVPIGIKDNISTRGCPTTCSSRMLENYNPIYNASVVEKLAAGGAVLLGKCKMDEFAMGGSTETAVQGPAKNPWDGARVPGGSSGGSAAAVASGMAHYALGSDTGGSIRQPSAFCGITGIKPSYGAVSRYGLIAYASSLDQIGPMARDMKDCAAVLSLISGPDPMDQTAVMKEAFDFKACSPADVKGMRIGLPQAYFAEGIDPQVKGLVLKAAAQMEALGASLEYFDLKLDTAPDISINELAVAAYYIISSAEASSNLSRYDGVKYGYRPAVDEENLYDHYLKVRSGGFGLEVKRRIMLGSFVLSSGFYDAYYNKALQVRGMIRDAFKKAFDRFDLILGPVAPTTAYPIGENISDPMKMYLGDIYTVSVNLAGLPAAALPCGFDGNGLPVGFQLIGKAFDEKTIVSAGTAFQEATDYHKQRPGRRVAQ